MSEQAELPRFQIFGLSGVVNKLILTNYADGNTAVLADVVYHDEDGETPEQPAISVNLAHGQQLQSKDLNQGEFFADTNDKEPIINALIACGWIEKTGVESPSGYVNFPVCHIINPNVVSQR